LKGTIFVVVVALSSLFRWLILICWSEREGVRDGGHGLVVLLGDLQNVRDEEIHGGIDRDILSSGSGEPANKTMVLTVRIKLFAVNLAVWPVALIIIIIIITIKIERQLKSSCHLPIILSST
jgi:hypothetical protein